VDRADAILARLGLREQAQVISEALAWPMGKVYFFQGTSYSKYDLGAITSNPAIRATRPRTGLGSAPSAVSSTRR